MDQYDPERLGRGLWRRYDPERLGRGLWRRTISVLGGVLGTRHDTIAPFLKPVLGPIGDRDVNYVVQYVNYVVQYVNYVVQYVNYYKQYVNYQRYLRLPECILGVCGGFTFGFSMRPHV